MTVVLQFNVCPNMIGNIGAVFVRRVRAGGEAGNSARLAQASDLGEYQLSLCS
jgi:hypothetical protein